MDRELLDGIARALQPIAPVRLAYVFGSAFEGRAHAESDLDLAVVLPRELCDSARYELLRAVVAAMVDELRPAGERVDVVELLSADPAVAFKAINGARVICRDERERVAVESRVARVYDDAPRRALYRRAARARWRAS